MTEQPVPRTEAGKRLVGKIVDDMTGMATWDPDTILDDILAIEAEATRSAFRKGIAAADWAPLAALIPQEEARVANEPGLLERLHHSPRCPNEWRCSLAIRGEKGYDGHGYRTAADRAADIAAHYEIYSGTAHDILAAQEGARSGSDGLTHVEAMNLIFERFFNRSFKAGYSFAEFQYDALEILDAALASKPVDDLGVALDDVRDAGMQALRAYHLCHFRDMLPSVERRHAHPVQDCPDEPFVGLAARLAIQEETDNAG